MNIPLISFSSCNRRRQLGLIFDSWEHSSTRVDSKTSCSLLLPFPLSFSLFIMLETNHFDNLRGETILFHGKGNKTQERHREREREREKWKRGEREGHGSRFLRVSVHLIFVPLVSFITRLGFSQFFFVCGLSVALGGSPWLSSTSPRLLLDFFSTSSRLSVALSFYYFLPPSLS